MYAVIRRYNINPGSSGEVLEKVNTDFVGKISQLPGFVSYHVINPNDDTLVSVSVFENRSSADESTRMATEWVRANLHRQLRSAPVITTGEIVVTSAEQMQ